MTGADLRYARGRCLFVFLQQFSTQTYYAARSAPENITAKLIGPHPDGGT